MIGSNPLVSIIIPVYNAEKYLVETINSAINQTWANKEIIIIDDGSSDNSLAIAKQFESNQVQVYSQVNKGASAARNVGLSYAKGDYIQFLDADDILSDNKIEAQIKVLNGTEDYLGLCGTSHFEDGSDWLSHPVQHDWGSEGTDDPINFLIGLYGGEDNGGMIQTNSWLTPKALINEASSWNETRNPDDDGEFFCRVILASKGIKYTFEGTNYYRKFLRQKSLSSLRDLSAFNGILFSIDKKYQYLKAASSSPKVDSLFAKQYWEIGLASYPQYKSFSKEVINKALKAGFSGTKYKGGRIVTIFSKLLGWRIIRTSTYIWHIIKNIISKPQTH